MKLISDFSKFVMEYESEKEYDMHRMHFTLDGYTVAKVVRENKNKIIVTYEKLEEHNEIIPLEEDSNENTQDM